MRRVLDFVHVGDYKTGTTWLQNTVFPFHPEIQYLGDPMLSFNQEKVLRELVDIRDLDFEPVKLHTQFKESFARDDKKIVGISREALSQSNFITGENAKRNAERIRLVFGEVKVVYTIRSQQTMLTSIYSEYLKSGGTRSFNDWFLDPIECKGIIERLKYDKNIKMYHDIFGKENVIVLLFEELVSDKKCFLEKLLSFIGCSNSQYVFQEMDNKINTSLTSYGATASKFLNKFVRNMYHNKMSTSFWIDKIFYKLAPISILNKDKIDKLTKSVIIPSYGDLDRRQRILFYINVGLFNKIRSLSEKISLGKKIEVKGEAIDKIMPLFIESNCRLKNLYDLEIDKYGWRIN
tara:strand:+ start:1302 stop:2348 length:1047 start_codon:yes stop_codon:yes gene_type:complete